MRPERQCESIAGRWRKSLPPLGAFKALLVLAAILIAGTSPAPGQELQFAHELSTRLNPTGRTVAMPVALRDHRSSLGDVVIQITAEDAILVEKAALLEKLAPVMERPLIEIIAATPDSAGFVPILALEAQGVGIRFDTGLQELTLDLRPEQRPATDISAGGRRARGVSAALTEPDFVAGYVNVLAGWDQMWGGSVGGDEGSPRIELESAVRIGEVVVENRASYEGEVDAAICPKDATCLYDHIAGFRRQSSALVVDLPDEQIRLKAGDADVLGVPIQRSLDLLGVSVEKSPRKLNPGESITSAGGGSFRLERNATVDVIVNGAVAQRLQLRPGIYNLRDLPLGAGSNNVELSIVDDTGAMQSVRFTAYADQSLLAEGKSEWAVAGGIPSYLIDNGRVYREDQYMGTGFYRYGLTDSLTGTVDLQGDEDVIMGGAGADMGTEWGLIGVHGALSSGEAGTGGAVDLRWSLVNFQGLTQWGGESLNANIEYRSTGFRTPGDFLSSASGILYPEFNYWLRLDVAYSAPVMNDITATLSARYQFGDEDRRNDPFTFSGDLYGADLTLSTSLTDTATASLLLGYSNELYPRGDDELEGKDPEFRAALRLNLRADETTTVSGGYDTLGRQATLSAHKSAGSGVDRWDTSIDADSRGHQELSSVNAGASYYGNRAELRLSHYADADGVAFDGFAGDLNRQRTSLRIGTALAFAGDKVAIGAPIRGGAFAIVAPHESLSDNEIIVGTPEFVRARADEFGNALVTDIPAYSPSSLSIDVADLPLGYSLGSGAFDLLAPYRAGYAIDVGSANSVTAYGTLVTADGEPLSLLIGTAYPENGASKPVTVFTNQAGKFGAEGLAPGRWILEMASEGAPTLYVLDVPESANGLVKVGTLSPQES